MFIFVCQVNWWYWFGQGYNTLWPSYLKPDLANDARLAGTLITEVNINDHEM